MNVSILQETPDSLLSSNLNDSISLAGFLDANGVFYSCSPTICSKVGYEYSGQASSKTVIISEYGQEKIVGFVINTSGLNVNSIKFNVSSSYEVSDYIPLVFNISDKKIIEFKNLSSDYSNPRLLTYGCFNFASGTLKSDKKLGSISYCEMVRLPRTTSLKLGVNFTGIGDTITMSLKSANAATLKSCTLEDPLTDNSCNVEYDLSEGEYYVCANAKESDSFNIYSEESGESCGWFNAITNSSSIDYSLFAKVPKYAAAPQNMILNLDSSTISEINAFIKDRYSTCSVGCVIPIRITGIPQSLLINNVAVSYSSSQGSLSDSNIYDLSEIKPKLDFKGILNLSLLGFDVAAKGNKTFILYFKNAILFSKPITVLGAPVIQNIYPIDPPAAVLIKFVAVVSSDNPIINYTWTFGDGAAETTTENFVDHTYNSLGSYILKVSVTDSKGVSVSKETTVIAGSPQEFLNITLSRKRADITSAINSISSFPAWYQKTLESQLKIIDLQDEINLIEKDRANAYEPGQFLNLSLRINALSVPSYVFYSDLSPSIPFITESEKIDLNPLLSLAVGNIEEGLETNYRQGIIQWQKSNIQATVTRKVVSVIMDSGEINDILSEYNIVLTSTFDEESYFILQKAMADATENPSSDLLRKASDSSSAVIIGAGETKAINFYVLGNEEPVMYISPKVDSLIVSKEISPCNYNYICESDKGEDYNNCRTDCKPVFPLVMLLIAILLVALIIYTALQVWYKQKYEVYLFKDRKELLNLVMFIANARARGMSDSQIQEELGKKGWSNEKIVYSMKKSRGEKTGMYEIIPVEKVIAYFREMKVKKEMKDKEKQKIQGKTPIKPTGQNILNSKKPLNFGFGQKKNVR
jgi:PKD repeat protein